MVKYCTTETSIVSEGQEVFGGVYSNSIYPRHINKLWLGGRFWFNTEYSWGRCPRYARGAL